MESNLIERPEYLHGRQRILVLIRRLDVSYTQEKLFLACYLYPLLTSGRPLIKLKRLRVLVHYEVPDGLVYVISSLYSL